MTKNLVIANGIIIFYIIQRIMEIWISKDNERWLKRNCHAVEVDKNEGHRMKIFHSMWFVSLILETNIKSDIHVGMEALGIYLILGLCMGVRFYCIDKLKRFWTIKIFSLQNQRLVIDGLYKYIRHPNYLVVIVEFVFLPLLFKAYLTLIVFSLINLIIISKRIKLEEVTLMGQTDYSEKFKGIKKLIPYFFILGFILLNPIHAKELSYQYKNYAEAKKSENYIKFEGASTKLGFITTGFDGYARDFKINYDLINTQLNNLEVKIVIATLDTDVESRNDKMVNSILNKDKYPEIHAAIIDKVILVNGEQMVNMEFTINGHKLIRPVKINVEKKLDYLLISGTTSIGLKELGLPDPSIVIAKVRDDFNLKFSIHLL